MRSSFLLELKKICIPEGDSSFNYHRFDGPVIDENMLRSACDSMPFMGDRVLVEIHDADLAKITLEDIPDYCTVVFINSEIDGRLKFVKSVENLLCFMPAEQNSLFRWVARRFAANGKKIDTEAIKRLIFVSGDLMNRLIPEIDKISGFSKGDTITVGDINCVASHIPDADIFEMVNLLADKQYDSAANILAELLADKNNSAISIISSISYQYRRIYFSKLIKNKKQLMDFLEIKYDFIADKLISTASKYSMHEIKNAIKNCVECEYKIKSSADDDTELLKSLFISLWKSLK